MSSMPPDPPELQPPAHWRDWVPSRRGMLVAALAFLIGLGLFALAWRAQDRHDFYSVEPVARPATEQAFDPLPAPLPAGREARGASGMGERAADDAEAVEATPAPQQVRQPPPPVAHIPEPMPPPTPAAATQGPVPIAGQTPAPRYPRRALRRGDRGTVLVRAEVGADGMPTSVNVARGSRSRELDRAAVEAVERWRFHPATADGRPVPGTVVVPIEFNPGR